MRGSLPQSCSMWGLCCGWWSQLHLYLKRPHWLPSPCLGHLAMAAPSWAWQRGWPWELEGTPGARVVWWAQVGCAPGQGKEQSCCCESCTAPRTTAVEPEETPQWYCSSGTASTGPEGLGNLAGNESKENPSPPAPKMITALILWPYWTSTTPKNSKLKIYEEKGEGKRKTLYLFFPPPCLLWTYYCFK